MLAELLILSSILTGVIGYVFFRETAEAILAWISKWRYRLGRVVLVFSAIIAFGTGSPLLMLYGAAVISGLVFWLLKKGDTEGLL